jgi:hypothetical protein
MRLLGDIFMIMTKVHFLTGFSWEAFEEMHDYLYDNVDHRVGAVRPRLLNSRDELGLILFYLGSSMSHLWLHANTL